MPESGKSTQLGFNESPRMPLPPPTVPPWGWGVVPWQIELELQGGGRRTDPPDRLREDSLATVRGYGRLDAVFYTDGSVGGGVENGGSAVVVSG